jgi:hypothetical protein
VLGRYYSSWIRASAVEARLFLAPPVRGRSKCSVFTNQQIASIREMLRHLAKFMGRWEADFPWVARNMDRRSGRLPALARARSGSGDCPVRPPDVPNKAVEGSVS